MIEPIKMPATTATNTRVDRVVEDVRAYADKVRRSLMVGKVDKEQYAELKRIAEMLQENYTAAEKAEILNRLGHEGRKLPEYMGRMETQLEMVQMRDLLASPDFSLDNFIMLDKYRNLVRKEWNLLCGGVAPSKDLEKMKFAFVGCGAMPLTAVGFVTEHGVSIDCFDVDPEAVKLASAMCERLGIDDKMRVQKADALQIDYSAYDVVFIANLVQPRRQAFNRVAAFDNVKGVITRRVDGLVTLIYSNLSDADMNAAGLQRHSTSDPADKTSVCLSTLLQRKPPQPRM